MIVDELFYFCFVVYVYFFFFKQKTAYEMRISDWSSDVCSSDLARGLSFSSILIFPFAFLSCIFSTSDFSERHMFSGGRISAFTNRQRPSGLRLMDCLVFLIV